MSHPSGERETILLVEDEIFVREAAAEALQDAGYAVISTGNASEALNLCHRSTLEINLLLADIVMPGMDGSELAGRFRALHTDAQVLLMSGHAAEFLPSGSLASGEMLLSKPFSVNTLLIRVKKALDKTFAAPVTTTEVSI